MYKKGAWAVVYVQGHILKGNKENDKYSLKGHAVFPEQIFFKGSCISSTNDRYHMTDAQIYEWATSKRFAVVGN